MEKVMVVCICVPIIKVVQSVYSARGGAPTTEAAC